ncbi:MAG TPA: branched-chain amino acid ABC transporter permease [Azospirillaceae bacterium]|nr:branched-chain amino acid ABC transporter permease [Azospirillaceae bacterium]
MTAMTPSGDFRTSYKADTTVFPTVTSRNAVILAVALACALPFVADRYTLNLLIQIGYLGIAALGLNILVGFTGQISIGHAAFFGVGAFASAWFAEHGVPVFFAIPLAGLVTTLVGIVFGLPAARLKGLYLAIATLAAQFILEDFFARARWFTGGVAGRITEPMVIFGFRFDSNETYFYVVLAYVVVTYLMVANLMRTRDGRALVAVRDHYLSAEMMGINLTKYRTLSFGISAFYAGLGGALYAHYLLFVSVEAFNILFSIQFLGMIIIGGLGSVMGSLMGTAFMVLLPEAVQWGVETLQGGAIDRALKLSGSIAYLREMVIGAVIILFLIFEPDGLAHRWKQIKAYWKLYPFSH